MIERLPLYVRVLTMFQHQGLDMVSSEQLGAYLHMTPAQIRKDLSYFGRFGKQGRGYHTRGLATELRRILGLDRTWNACVVGVGRLGRAIIGYPGFTPEGFRIVSAFDSDNTVIETKIGDVPVDSLCKLRASVRKLNISIAIVAVPAESAQAVVDQIVEAGIQAILNYAPVTLRVPVDVKVQNIDPVLSLQSMTYYLKRVSASA